MQKTSTSKGLPIITRECKDDLYNSLADKQLLHGETAYGDFLGDTKHRLTEENPILLEFINEQVGKYPPQLHNPMFEIICGIYGLMEKQNDDYKQKRKSTLEIINGNGTD